MVAPGELFGGAERQILLLLEHLRSTGVHCALVLFHDREIAQRARALRIPTYVVNSRMPLDPTGVAGMVRRLRSEGCNIVHVHGYKPAVFALAARLALTFRTVKTEHGGAELDAAPFFVRTKLHAYRKLENLSARLLGATVIYVTEDLRRRCAAEHEGLPQQVIPNGIDAGAIRNQPAATELEPHRFNLVLAGRLEPVKGAEVAIRALADPRMPADALLFVIGDGPQRNELHELAAHCGVVERVRFMGFRKDAVAFIAHADAVLIPSLHEGLPYTLLEAVAARTPVVASRVGGLAEVLCDRSNALLIESGDAAALAEAVRTLHANPCLGESLALRAETDLLPRFTAVAMGEAYLALYRRLCSPDVTR
jgi:glycosyltransferase involved in cell wall biosynthesis